MVNLFMFTNKKGVICMYNKKEVNGNMTYSIDMIRLKTYITYSTFTEIEFRFNTVWKEYVKKYYTTGRMKEFFYNYNIEVGEGLSFWFGFLHNTEKREPNEYNKYNLTIEFNPNKLKDNKIIFYLLSLSGEWYIKSYDLAIDIDVNILDLIVDSSGRQQLKIISNGYDDKTYSLGKGDGRLKVYNKKKESNLNILGDLTRVEISRVLEDYPITRVHLYHFGDVFPKIYLNRYVMSLSDYKDKTLLAILYAVQNGFPIRDLSRNYKEKIKKMFEGGYDIKFYQKYADKVLQQTIYFYFIKNAKVNWNKGLYIK